MIELVIAVAMIGILAAIAYPSYLNVVIKNNRAVAHASLTELAARQESYFSQRRAYAGDLTGLGYPTSTIFVKSDGGIAPNNGSVPSGSIYKMTVVASNARGFLLEAGPVNVQSQDTQCGSLRLDAQGVKTASTGDSNCW